MKEQCVICEEKKDVYLVTLFGEPKCQGCVEGSVEKGAAGTWTLDELVEHARELSMRHWGTPYDGKIEIVNHDWKRMVACIFVPRPHSADQTIRIRFSKKVNKRVGKERILRGLLHELVHWWMFTQNLPYHDDDSEFIKECIRVGAPVSHLKGVFNTLRESGYERPEDFVLNGSMIPTLTYQSGSVFEEKQSVRVGAGQTAEKEQASAL